MSCPYCEGFVRAHGEPFKAVKDKESDTLWVYFHGTCTTCGRSAVVCVPATIDWEEYTDLEEED